jgi:hypothetical protein
MSASDLLPYLVAAGFPVLLLGLYALFRWRYLRSVRQHLYTPAGVPAEPREEEPQPVVAEPSEQVRQIEITWTETADIVGRPEPPSLVEAYRRTGAMRAALAVSGAVFTVCAGAIVWYALRAHGWQARSAWVIGSLNTFSGLFVTLTFARLRWARSIGVMLAWIALQFALLLGAAKLSLPVAASLIAESISLNGIPVLGAGLLALRTTRVLTVAFMPALFLLIMLTTAVVIILEVLGIRVEGTPSVSAATLGAAALVIGLVVIVRQIRRGLDRRFVAMWLSATCAFALMAWLTDDQAWTPLVGIGVNGTLVMLWWGLFTRFLRLRADGRMPDEILHFSGCLAVLAVWIGALTAVTRFELLWLLIPFGAYAITLWALLRRRRPWTSFEVPRLLLLRVFHQTPRDSWLIDTLDDSWRRAGRLDLTVGLDVALRAVNTLALENFFLGRVHRYLFKSMADVRERLSGLPQAMALDGRYPLNELHCLLDTWEWVVEALVREARVVLMDLRGLSASNTGALRELSMVIPWVPLSQIVILSDRSTDERLLTEGIRDAWSQVPAGSPNFCRSNGALRLLRCSGSRHVDARAVDWAVFTAASGEQAVHANGVTASA